MRRSSSLVPPFGLVTVLLAACGGGADDGETSRPKDATTPGPAPEPALATARSGIGPVHAPPGGEDTYCIHKRLDNETAGYVRRVRGELTEGSHHMIVYLSDETEEQLEPEPCGGFSGIFVLDEGGVPGLDSVNVPIFIAQQPYVELAMPKDEGVPIGFRVEAHQMLRIELHWYNTTSAPRDVIGAIELDMIPEAEADRVIESSFAFWGTTAIDLPPHSKASTPVLFQRALTDTKAFAVTTHQHQLGTRMRVWESDGTPGVEGKRLLADATEWAEPPLEMLDPPVVFESGDGLAYQCEWNNTTNEHVDFGEEFDQEMCFLWAYYYPSVGFDICIHFADGAAQGICNHLVR